MPEQPPGIYLDYNATAPLLPTAMEALVCAARELPGNPSSPHQFGQAARSSLERGRNRLAAALGVNRREVIFTSGGSEANNLLLRSLEWDGAKAHLITSSIEHPSVLQVAEYLASRGVAVSYLPVDGEGRILLEGLADILRPQTRMVSIMAANNETGVLQPVADLVRRLHAEQSGNDWAEGARPWIHTDAVQAFGRIPLNLAAWGVDGASIAAHKLGGPKGIGALICRNGLRPPPQILGGAQERGLRAGTESPALVAGFTAAVEHLMPSLGTFSKRLASLRDGLEAAVADIDGVFFNGQGAERLPNTSNLGFEGVSAQSLLAAMDLSGFALSGGSACSSGAVTPSHVLLAMGCSQKAATESVRISLGWGTTAAEIDRCSACLRQEVNRIRGGPAHRRPA